MLRWCNLHLLRGRIVIASRERERDVRVHDFQFFIISISTNIGIYSTVYKEKPAQYVNMSCVLDLLDVVICIFLAKNVKMNVHVYICMSYIFIFERCVVMKEKRRK